MPNVQKRKRRGIDAALSGDSRVSFNRIESGLRYDTI